ncbi:MAG: AAA family ATPase [Acidimicrobiia bacterium]
MVIAPSVRGSVGVTVGKFNPPHLGHLHLIRSAAARVDHLYVLVADRPGETIAAGQRAAWLGIDSPGNVTILVTPDNIPAANEPWAERALDLLPQPPDVAFTSELWGPGWAEAMGAAHAGVDLERDTFPISATELRQDLRSHFDWLAPAARVDLVHRVVVAGAESTGKTTLAEALARHFHTTWVPEYGRTYWHGRAHLVDKAWHFDEFRHIASTHHQMADGLARHASNGLLMLDTDALVTNVWHHRYRGELDPGVAELARLHRPDLYLIAAPDFEWVKDGTRESRDQREEMHRLTLELVAGSGAAYEVVGGTHDDRMARAVAAIEAAVTYPVFT